LPCSISSREWREVLVLALETLHGLLALPLSISCLAATVAAAVLDCTAHRTLTRLDLILLPLPLLPRLLASCLASRLLRSGLLDLDLDTPHCLEQRVPVTLMGLAVLLDRVLVLFSQVALDVKENDPIHGTVDKAAVERDVLDDESEMRKHERVGVVHLDAKIVADALVVELTGALEAVADDAPDLNEFCQGALAAEEGEGERGWVCGIRALDEGGDGASEVFVHVCAETELVGVAGLALVAFTEWVLGILAREVHVLSVLRVVGELADRHIEGDEVLAATGRCDDGDGSVGAHDG
jgi:hypothetical protein